VEYIRSFIAIDIEDPVLAEKIEQVKNTILSSKADLKPVERENIHITLRFLGNIPLSLVDEIYKIMQGLEFKPFNIHIKGLGAFPRINRPRVIWIGIEEGAEELKRIQKQLESGLRKIGIRPEKEEFIPHITIARVRSGRNRDRLVKILVELSDVDIGFMTVNSIRLKQSILTPKGPIYKTLREVKV